MTTTDWGLTSGTDSMLREALGRVADEVASRNSRLAIVVPAKEIIAAFYAVLGNVPRIPDYDHPTALAKVFAQPFGYSPDEVPDEVPELRVRLDVDTEGQVGVRVDMHTMRGDETCLLDLDAAEEFFLTGLAAVRTARRHPDRVAGLVASAEPEVVQADDGATGYGLFQIMPDIEVSRLPARDAVELVDDHAARKVADPGN